ncbi:hypothetical protein OSTOST_16704 [Ostertagia ostertagi]
MKMMRRQWLATNIGRLKKGSEQPAVFSVRPAETPTEESKSKTEDLCFGFFESVGISSESRSVPKLLRITRAGICKWLLHNRRRTEPGARERKPEVSPPEKSKHRSASRSKIVERSRSRKKRAKEGSGKEKTSDRKSKKDHHSIVKSRSKHRSFLLKKSKISAKSRRE